MGKSTPKAPAAPDPVATANAQTTSNVDTAISNAFLQNPNVISAYGETSTGQTGSVNVDGRDIPLLTTTTQLSPDEQKLFDQQNQLGQAANGIALSQVGKIGSILGTAPPQLSDYLGDPTKVRDNVQNALFARLQPQLQIQSDALENKLTNQGLVRGSEAFENADVANSRDANDARLAVIGQAGTEQDRVFSEAQQQLQDALTARDQPLNELTALAGYGQVQNPTVPTYQPGTVAGTPTAQIVQNSFQDANDVYKSQLAAQSSTLGSIFGLGGAIAGAAFRSPSTGSDIRLKRDIRPLGVKLRNGLPLYSYRYLSSEDWHVGVLAHEAAEVVPEAVEVGPDGFSYVDYGAIVA